MRVRFDKHNLLSFMANEFLQFSNFLKAFQKKIIHLHMHWKPTFAERVSFHQTSLVSSYEIRFIKSLVLTRFNSRTNESR